MICLFVYCLCVSTQAEVRGQLAGVGFSPSNIGSQGSNSGHQVWQQSPLPTQPSRWLILVFVQHFFLQGRKAQIQGTIQLAASLHFENCHVAQVGVEIPVFLFVLPRCMLESSSSMSVYICTT